LPSHAHELQASRIDAVTAGLACVHSAQHDEAYDTGIRGEGDLRGLLFPYWDPAEQRFSRRFVRVKPDTSIAGRKYLQPVGERPRPYFMPGVSMLQLEDASLMLLVTEGEKKALALERTRLELGINAVVIGLGGVWGWRESPKELQPDGTLGKGKSRAIPDFDLVRWAGRTVYLIFDSDAVTNWKVAAAETALAKVLASRGARVFIVRLPGGDLCRKLA
jgi:hypothetical protein